MQTGRIELNGFELSYILRDGQNNTKTPLLLLHGFSGSAKDWLFYLEQLPEDVTAVALDIIGHGESGHPDTPEYYRYGSIASQINLVLNKLGFQKVILLGYSMGGRAALAFANKFPQKTEDLILESTSFGIEDEQEKRERSLADERLVKLLTSEGIEKFFDYWFSLPLFATLKKLPGKQLAKIKNQRLQNSPTGLANILREFSQGKMPYYLSQPDKYQFPVLLITGELDEKYKALNKKYAKVLPHCKNIIVEGAGHNVHLEKPLEFINFTHEFLKSIWEEKWDSTG